MTQRLQTLVIAAPGFMGLNTQDSSLELAQGYALTATNCIIDQYGRIGSRKGWSPENTSSVDLGTSQIQAMGQMVTNGGAEYFIVAGNNKLFKMNGGSLVTLTYGGGGVAPTITASNWQMASLNNVLYMFQLGHDPLIFDPAVSTTTYRRVSEKTGYLGTVPSGNVVLSAYGRLWVADTATNKTTVYFSDLLAGHIWSTGTSGSLNLDTVWPNGSDNVTGLTAHNGFLDIFGKNSILVYSGATDPSTMALSDTVSGMGCIARDSIQNTGTDSIFLSDTGVRSLMRTIQEKSAPFRDLSKNVRNDLMSAVADETLANVKSIYSPFESFYLLTFPSLGIVYCFDQRGTLQDGSSRVTIWDSIVPTSFAYLRDKTLMIGTAGFVGKYGTYLDDGETYRMQYFTNHADLGSSSVTSILKKLSVVVIGGSDQYVSMKWGYDFTNNYFSQTVKIPTQAVDYYGVGEYNIAEYNPGVSLQTLVAYPSGSGKIIQTGYETEIAGAPLSIQKIEIQTKDGKIA